nr:ribonuclease H-like domain-containing protein [Tanacetum cinerariifolium]
MKARGTLLMVLLNKEQLKFHSYQDTKLLMEVIEKRYGGNKESKKDHYAQIKIYKIWLSYPQTTLMKQISLLVELVLLILKDLEQINPDDLEEMDLHWKMAMLTIRAIRAPKNQDNRGREYGRKTVPVETPTENTLIAHDGIGSSDYDVDSCSKTCMKAYANLKEEYDKERLVYYKKNEAVFTDKINVLNLEVKLRDNVLVEYTKNLEKAEKKRAELKLILEKLQNSSNSLNKLLDSQVSDKFKTGLGYKEITPDSFSSEMLENQKNVKSRLDKGYHAVPSPFTENYMTHKRDLRLIDEHVESVSVDVISNIAPSDVKTVESTHKTIGINHKGCVQHRDCKTNVETSRVNHKNFANKLTHPQLKRGFVPQPVLTRVNDSTARDRAVVSGNIRREVNPQQKEYKEKRVINSGCSRHMTGNKCYLTNFEAYDDGFVSFGDGKGRIYGKGIENQLKCKVKVIRCDNRTEFKNNVINQFCEDKGIKREYDITRTPQQNRIAERRNRTLIEAARTMLVDSKLPTTFWAEAANTTCYVLNKALVTKPHNKTPYELIRGRPPLIDFMKPFGCLVTILNTRDNLGKFEGKLMRDFFGYSMVSKAMRVFSKRNMIVEETLNIRFLKNAPNVKGNRPDWLFDIDSLTISMNYVPGVVGNQINGIAGSKENLVAGQDENKKELKQEYILIPICTIDPLISKGTKVSVVDAGKKATEVDKREASDYGWQDDQVPKNEVESLLQQERQTEHNNSTNSFNTASSPVSTAGPSFVNTAPPSPINAAGPSANTNAFEEHPFE